MKLLCIVKASPISFGLDCRQLKKNGSFIVPQNPSVRRIWDPSHELFSLEAILLLESIIWSNESEWGHTHAIQCSRYSLHSTSETRKKTLLLFVVVSDTFSFVCVTKLCFFFLNQKVSSSEVCCHFLFPNCVVSCKGSPREHLKSWRCNYSLFCFVGYNFCFYQSKLRWNSSSHIRLPWS